MARFKVVFALLLVAATAWSQMSEDVNPLSKKAEDLKGTVATPGELKCLGFISDSLLPLNVYISGTEYEGLATSAVESTLVYLNGPEIKSLKIGEHYRVVRAEGRVKDSLTSLPLGIYYKEVGAVRVDALRQDGASATVTASCRVLYKGDLLLPGAERTAVKYTGELSNGLTPYFEQGLASSIILGQDDIKEMAAGQFCFIGVGKRDGVNLGDRFTVYHLQPPFEPRDLIVNAPHSNTSYGRLQGSRYYAEVVQALRDRKLPPRILGDLVVVDVAETTSAAKIINSRSEIHVGDLVVRR